MHMCALACVCPKLMSGMIFNCSFILFIDGPLIKPELKDMASVVSLFALGIALSPPDESRIIGRLPHPSSTYWVLEI